MEDLGLEARAQVSTDLRQRTPRDVTPGVHRDDGLAPAAPDDVRPALAHLGAARMAEAAAKLNIGHVAGQYGGGVSASSVRPFTQQGSSVPVDTLRIHSTAPPGPRRAPGEWEEAWAHDGIDVGELGDLYRPRYFHSDGIAVHAPTMFPPTPPPTDASG